MPLRLRLMLLATVTVTGSAFAADYNNAASYNSGYGMAAGQENQAVNPSLRDQNGNLTVVNGQFTSSSFSRQTGVQSVGTISSGALSSLGTSQAGVGTYGTATAIGNSLNVVTIGNNNTVVINSSQINNGDQNANVSINGSSGK
jgi:holdfast attachment protein HfaA